MDAPRFEGWDEEADVVVVGGGLAGHCAALELASRDAEVLLIEKQAQVGGSSVLSGGSFAFAGTDLQRKNGVDDTSELLFDDLRRVGGYKNDEAVVRAYVDNQLDTYYWLASHGVVFEKFFLAAGQSVPRAHSHNPCDILDKLASRAAASGCVTMRVHSPVSRLLRSRLDGPVEGVLSHWNGKWRATKARRGVVLTSGGFSCSDLLLKLFAPSLAKTQRTGGLGNMGDGLVMAWHLGAGMRDMGYIKCTFGGYPSALPCESALMLPIYVGAITVSLRGERFIDVSKSCKLIGDAMLDQPDALGFQVFDQKIFDKGQPGISTMAFQAKHAQGHVISALTLAELAKKVGIDPKGLAETVEAYNTFVDEGKDYAFGCGALAKIDMAPFYAYPSKCVIMATYCGVSVDPQMCVRDAVGKVIPNLYAAGEVVGGLHGHGYMTGSSLGKAAIFGRLAGQSALSDVRMNTGAGDIPGEVDVLIVGGGLAGQSAVDDVRMSAGAGEIPGEVDILIVGGGLAGYCAALEAARLGADTLLIEKEAKIGGATILSGGSFAFAGTPLQKSLGIDDSDDRLYADLRRVGGYENDETLVRTYVARQRETYDWLGTLGATFERVFIASGQSVPRAHSRNAQEVLDIVADHAHRTGRMKTRLSTAAQCLIRSASGGTVTGATVESGGKSATIHARHGVVLATGGFSRNEGLLNLFVPGQAGAQRMGGPGNTGDGLLMAWRLGAGFRDMAYIKGTFGNHPSAGPEDHFLLFPIYAGGIAVNAKAQRFVDESLSYKLIGDACLKQPGCIGYQIFDQPIFERGRPGIPSMDFQADLEAGRVITAPTLKGIAAKLGLDATALECTVAEYNAFVEQGRDAAFGRDGLCNHYGTLVKIGTAPFYAFASRSVVLATYCGLTVDAHTRVKDVYGALIPNLFAIGGVIGGFHGKAYMTGTANGKAAIFGRISAHAALKQ